MSWISCICYLQGPSAEGWGGGAGQSSGPSFTTDTDSDCFLLKWLLRGHLILCISLLPFFLCGILLTLLVLGNSHIFFGVCGKYVF